MQDIDIWDALESHTTEQARTYDDITDGDTLLLTFGKPHAHGSRSIKADVTGTEDIGKEITLTSGDATLRAYCDRAKPVLEVTADGDGDFRGSIGRVNEMYITKQ